MTFDCWCSSSDFFLKAQRISSLGNLRNVKEIKVRLCNAVRIVEVRQRFHWRGHSMLGL